MICEMICTVVQMLLPRICVVITMMLYSLMNNFGGQSRLCVYRTSGAYPDALPGALWNTEMIPKQIMMMDIQCKLQNMACADVHVINLCNLESVLLNAHELSMIMPPNIANQD